MSRVPKVYKRVDAQKNQAKVAKVLIKAPLSTQREIAAQIGVSKSTVQEHLLNLKKETKDDRIIGLTDSDLDIVTLAQKIIIEKMNNPEEMRKTRIGELSGVARESSARYTVFRGEVTDNKGGLKPVLTQKQLEAIEALRDFFEENI